MLRMAGCSHMQGFLFSATAVPMSELAFADPKVRRRWACGVIVRRDLIAAIGGGMRPWVLGT